MERSLVSLLGELRCPGLRHAVVTLRDAGGLSERLPEDVACCAIGASGRSWSSGMRLARIARRWNASVLHARGTGCWNDAIVAGALARRARVVLGYHGLEASKTFGRRHRRSARLGLLTGARFTSVFETGVRQLHTELSIPLDRIDLLRNGVRLNPVVGSGAEVRRRIREEFRLGQGTFVVGVVGSLTPVKRHDVLLEAFARVLATRARLALLIVGDGPLRDSLARRVCSDGTVGRVRFAGWREDVAELLRSMDAYVCSSASEGMSNALLEALAAKLPVVVTDVGDNASMVRDGVDGLVIKPGSVEAVARALTTLIDRPLLRKRLATSAGTRARRYDLARTVEAYETYYRSLARGLHSRRGSPTHPSLPATALANGTNGLASSSIPHRAPG